MTLVDVAGAGQLHATWADIDIALLVEDKIGATESAIGARRLVPHRNVRCDLTIDQPLEQTDRAINGVARQSLGLQTKARATRSIMVRVTEISTTRLARVPSASMIIPALLSMR